MCEAIMECSDIETQLNLIIDALQGKVDYQTPIDIELETRPTLVQTKKFDITPKGNTSAIDDYIAKHNITRDMIVGITHERRTDGILTIILLWGPATPIIIAGPPGANGPAGPAGRDGPPGPPCIQPRCRDCE